MDRDAKEKILKNCIETYGEDQQINIAVEESLELARALCRTRRITADFLSEEKHVKEEMADVLIMLWQLMIIFDFNENEMNEAVEKKLNRQRIRMEEYGKD